MDDYGAHSEARVAMASPSGGSLSTCDHSQNTIRYVLKHSRARFPDPQSKRARLCRVGFGGESSPSPLLENDGQISVTETVSQGG